MKKVIWIVGGFVCICLIIGAMFVAMTIGMSLFFHYRAVSMVQAYKEQAAQQNQQQIRKSIESLGTGAAAQAKKDADELSGKLPSLFVDSGDYKIEDNWLATMISREITGMSFIAAHPDQPLPDFKVKARVDSDKPQVHVEITGYDPGTTRSDLTPAFAWDPEGYAPLAKKLLSGAADLPSVPSTDATDVMGHLLNLTGQEIALEDVRLSNELQQHPNSSQDHEAAALVLIALALRDNVGVYNDKRMALSRATAHLAVAKALRGDQPATLPGQIADAAIRTLSGREIDAVAHLDTISVEANLPDSVKTWVSALRMWATQNWRLAEVKPDSPLLLKIVWFSVLSNDIPQDTANDRLAKVVPPTLPVVNGQPNDQRINPDTLLPDWSRIAGKSPFSEMLLEDPNNGKDRLDLELHELDDELQPEGEPALDLSKLGEILSVRATDTVAKDASGKTTVHVIGPDMLKAVGSRQLMAGLPTNDASNSGPADAQLKNLLFKYDKLFQGVPGYDLARLHLGIIDLMELPKQYDALVAAHKTWEVWDVSPELSVGMPGYACIGAFYKQAVPFGTVYEPALRENFVRGMDPQPTPPFDTPELEQIKKLPTDQALTAISAYQQKYNALIAASVPKEPTPFEKKLLQLNPDNAMLITDHVPPEKVMSVAGPLLDYNMNVLEKAGQGYYSLSPEDRQKFAGKEAAIDSDYTFGVGIALREAGKVDEAAAADRKAFANTADPIVASNSTLPLVDYDLTHAQQEEALSIGKKAFDVGSEIGMGTYCYVLEKTGKLDQAEEVAKKIRDNYSEDSWLATLYIRHREKYPDYYAEALKQAYPNGLVPAKLSDFTDKPKTGCAITSWSYQLKEANLQQNDVVVGLDGYRIDSEAQYTFTRALSSNPEMDFIVWRDGKYQEVKGSAIDRRMFVGIGDYQGN